MPVTPNDYAPEGTQRAARAFRFGEIAKTAVVPMVFTAWNGKIGRGIAYPMTLL
jgi:hypothetical protein